MSVLVFIRACLLHFPLLTGHFISQLPFLGRSLFTASFAFLVHQQSIPSDCLGFSDLLDVWPSKSFVRVGGSLARGGGFGFNGWLRKADQWNPTSRASDGPDRLDSQVVICVPISAPALSSEFLEGGQKEDDSRTSTGGLTRPFDPDVGRNWQFRRRVVGLHKSRRLTRPVLPSPLNLEVLQWCTSLAAVSAHATPRTQSTLVDPHSDPGVVATQPLRSVSARLIDTCPLSPLFSRHLVFAIRPYPITAASGLLE